MRSPLRAFVVTLVSALAGVIALNGWVDAAGLGTFQRTFRLSRLQSPDDQMVSETTFNQRAWVRGRLLGARQCPEVLVLGSSTTGALRQAMFPGRRFLNAWMGGPTVEDFEAVAEMMSAAHCVPRAIVVGVDPWWVGNPSYDDQRWVSVLDDFVAYHRRRGSLLFVPRVAEAWWGRLGEALNFTTTRESLALVARRARGDVHASAEARLVRADDVEICRQATEAWTIRAYDGHYTSCPSFVAGPAQVRTLARDYLVSGAHGMSSWESLDRGRIARLFELVRGWTSVGVHVVLVAPPYHPTTHALLVADPRIGPLLDATDAALDAHAHGAVTYLNLRDPASVGCTADEFEDSHHAAPSCSVKVAARIARALP